MDEYISREMAVKKLQMQLLNLEADQDKGEYSELCENRGARDALDEAIYDIRTIKAADVQEKKYCKMIPLEPDCLGYVDVFICTNCHQHIHLGFIQKEYSGSFCLECGAEVKDGDTSEKMLFLR